MLDKIEALFPECGVTEDEGGYAYGVPGYWFESKAGKKLVRAVRSSRREAGKDARIVRVEAKKISNLKKELEKLGL